MHKSLFLLSLAAGLVCGLAANGCSSGGSNPPSLPPPPQNMLVVSFSPPNAATGIPTSALVVVTFNEDVNPSTLVPANFIVSDLGGAIPGTITYDANTRTGTFTPAGLPVSSQVTVNLTAEIQSTTGDPLAAGSFAFNTGTAIDTTPPTFAGAATAAAESGANILVSWGAGVTDDIDPGAYVSFNIYRATTTGGQNFTVPIGRAGPSATSFRDRGLTATTQYFYVVRAVDTSGNEETNTVEVNTTTNALTSWSTDVYPLFTLVGPQNCSTSGCHEAATNSGGLTMEPIATAYAELSNFSGSDGGCSSKQRVEPGDAFDSFLYDKLVGTPSCGSAMPLNAAPFNATQLDTVRDWIDEGALNN